MTTQDWKDEQNVGDKFQIFERLKGLTEKFATRSVNLGKSNENEEIPEMNKYVYSNNGKDILSDCDNITTGESDYWFGCNNSMLEALNMSTVLSPTKNDNLYDIPWSMIIGLSPLYGAMSLSALFGNSLVLWIVAVSRRMRTVTNMFIANLALADFIIGLFAIPFQFQAALLDFFSDGICLILCVRFIHLQCWLF